MRARWSWDPGAYGAAVRATAAALAACSERLLLCTLPADLGRRAPRPSRTRRAPSSAPSPPRTAPCSPSSTTSPGRRGRCPTPSTPTARGQLEIADRAARALGATQLPSSLIEVYDLRRARARFAARWGALLARDLRRRAVQRVRAP